MLTRPSLLNCREFIDKDKWPPNSPDLTPLDYYVCGAMLERYQTFHSKPKNIEDLKNALQVIRDQLPQVSINKATVSFTTSSSLFESWERRLWTYFAINLKGCFNFYCYLILIVSRLGLLLRHWLWYKSIIIVILASCICCWPFRLLPSLW